jgi:hypothetical protein
MRRLSVITGVLFTALAVSGCRLEKDEAAASRNARATIPAAAPSITGVVTDVGSDSRIRIEERPTDTSGSAKAVVRLAENAAILTRAGSPATFGAIQTGMRVSAWFIGPVMESYPVQATANVIVIESGVP